MNQILPQFSSVGPASSADLEASCKAAIAAGTVLDATPIMKLFHSFIPGAYARSLWRPKGTLIVGKMHRFPCFTFLLSGRLAVWENGTVIELTAGAFFVSPAGSKKITFAREDSELVTVHGTWEQDLARLEAELIVPEITEVLPESVKTQLIGNEA